MSIDPVPMLAGAKAPPASPLLITVGGVLGGFIGEIQVQLVEHFSR